MNTKILKSAFVLLAIIIVAAGASIVSATVGGETLVYDLKYDSKTASVYYTEQSYSGKGCPPELKAISIASNAEKTIYACDDFKENQAQEISTFTQGFASLASVNLRKNSIKVVVNAVGEEKMEGEDYVIKTNLVATVLQDNVVKASIPFSGCSAEQPLVVDGYRIIGVPDKLVLIFSGKGNCWEGGYVEEHVHVVSGIQIKDDTETHAWKSQSALVPNEGSLVVYTVGSAADNSTATPAKKRSDGNMDSFILQQIAIVAGISLILGIFIGRFTKKDKVQ